jgi:hypothetical protein
MAGPLAHPKKRAVEARPEEERRPESERRIQETECPVVVLRSPPGRCRRR